MPGGAYIALSGLRARIDQLDRLASDIANVDTAGYKAERSTTAAAERPSFENALQSAIDVAPVPGHIDFRSGAIASTGRDLDLAIEGPGFFVVDTPVGPRFTRNGHFTRRADGVLTTPEGLTVQGVDGPITLPAGEVSVQADGTVQAGGAIAGQLRLVDFTDYRSLSREEGARFRAANGATPSAAASATLKAGALEEANVSVVERLVQLTEVSRSFEALQRGISVLMNEIDGRAISEIGRR